MAIIRHGFITALAALLGTGAVAQTPSQPGATFLKVFGSVCVRRVHALEALRNELIATGLPALAQAAATVFLDGRPGDVWPVPEYGASGNLVLVLPAERSECSVLARRGPIGAVEAEFRKVVQNPPSPITSVLETDEVTSTAANGEVHTMGYVWKVEGQATGIAFLLTTASSPDAPLQLKATVVKVSAP